MPPVSEAQRRAMFAAAEGRSTLGIPKAVGKEFVAADATAGHAAGILFVAPDGDVLLLRRSSTEANFAGHWALPGGKAEKGEGPYDAALRELEEETGYHPEDDKARLIDQRITPTGMAFHTFAMPAAEKFVPKLNDEHSGFAWAPLDQLPQPLHPAVAATLADRLGTGAEDMRPEDWQAMRTGFAKWTREEEREAGHAQDGLALDKASVRQYDKDGRLHVEKSNISKAAVNEYLGSEIPGNREFGLDPAKRYKLLRDPGELKKASPTFNNLPILSRHVPVTADAHRSDLTIGSTGTDAAFDGSYLTNSLVFWPRDAIAAIESEERQELSSAYHYRADMTPGEFEGQKYDGVMRDIVGNHVALVREGRAGPDVVVGDSALPTMEGSFSMPTAVLSRKALVAQGAIMALLRPKLAQDAKVDLTPAFVGVSAKNFTAKLKDIATAIGSATKGKLAQDADMSDVAKMLDALGEVEVAEGADTDPNSGLPMSAEEMKKKAMDDDPIAKIKEFLKGKIGDDDMSALDKILGDGKAMDAETDEEKAKREAAEKAAKEAAPATVTKPAMDAAIAEAVRATKEAMMKSQREIRDAEKAVRPYIGELAMAHDSAEAVYRTALTALGVAVDGVHPSAFPAILSARPKPGARRVEQATVAMDAAASDDFNKMFPTAARIGVQG